MLGDPSASAGAQPAATFHDYTQYLADVRGRPLPHGVELLVVEDADLGAWARHLLVRTPHSIRARATRTLAPLARRRLERLVAGGTPPRLQLGCGPVGLEGWINIDVLGSAADVIWDLRRSLPLRSGTVSAIFHEHVLEHFELVDAVKLTRECWRLLQPGGILRVGVPDFGRYASAYVLDDPFIEQVRPGRPTSLVALSEIVYPFEHRSVWDERTLVALMSETGFDAPAKCSFGVSAIPAPVPDGRHREQETLYVEATKPVLL